MLNNIKTKERGFTIVELLIVIVVIAILAAISIVAYNGIQNRGKTSAGQSLANSVIKKAEAYNTIQSYYPAAVSYFATGPDESRLDNASAVLSATVDGSTANGGNAVSYVPCGVTGTSPNQRATGATIAYWRYDGTAAAVSKTIGTCA